MKQFYNYALLLMSTLFVGASSFAQCGAGDVELYLTTSGGSFATEKWVIITDGINGSGNVIWAQGDGTYGNGQGLVTNEPFCITPGNDYYITCYDRYADGWDGTVYSIVDGNGVIVANNGGVSPDDGTDTDASSSFEPGNEIAEQESSELFNYMIPGQPTIALTNTPDCANGAILDITTTPGTDEAYYWQASGNSVSTANAYAGPMSVFANGWYYANTYNSVTGIWSFTDSIEITTIPSAATPSAPVADINPSCFTTGTVLTADPAPIGLEYYWQETNSTGNSTTLPATSTYAVSTSGTYYLAAYDPATQCWSDPHSSIDVVVNDVLPSTPNGTTEYSICAGETSLMLDAAAPSAGSVTVSSGTIDIPVADDLPTAESIISIAGIPAGVTVTSFDVNFNITHTYDGDLDIYLVGPNGSTIELSTDNGGGGDNYVNTTISSSASTAITSGSAPFTGTFLPEGNLADLYSMLNGDYTLQISDDAGGDDGTLHDWSITITYDAPPATTEWYDAATGGNYVGSGTPFEAIGTSVMSSPAVDGVYTFYAESDGGACVSADRLEVTVNVNAVLVELTAIDVTCEGGSDGSFSITNTSCGTAPFTFSVDGGSFGPAPTNLTPGDYSVIVQDNLSNQSAAITVTIANGPAPTALVVDVLNDVDATVSWTVNGSETSWNIEWGTPGFTPGTGAEIGSDVANAATYQITGLTESTTYDVYVSSACGTAGEWVMVSFTTSCSPIDASNFCEGFNSDSQTEGCWTVVDSNNDADFDDYIWNTDYPSNTYEGDEAAVFYSDFNGGSNDDWLISPWMTLTGNEVLNFFYRVQSSFEPNDFELLLSTTGMAPADFQDTLMYLDSYDNTVYLDTTVDLSAYTGNVYIAWHIPGGGLDGWRLYIDQVCFKECIPTASTSGSMDVCRLDTTANLFDGIVAGEDYGTWIFADDQSRINGSEFNVTNLAAGSYEVMYLVEAGCTNDTSYATVNVYGPSNAGQDGTITACKNQPVNLLAGLQGNVDLGGTWYDPGNNPLNSGAIITPNFTANYNYDYITSNGVCPNDTSNVVVTVIDCDYLSLDESIFTEVAIYPNPTSGKFTVANIISVEDVYYEVTDLSGKVIVATTTVKNGTSEFEVDLTNAQTGVYILRMFNSTGNSVFRIIKN